MISKRAGGRSQDVGKEDTSEIELMVFLIFFHDGLSVWQRAGWCIYRIYLLAPPHHLRCRIPYVCLHYRALWASPSFLFR